MSKTAFSTVMSSAKNTFNLLKEWQDSKDAEKDYYWQADNVIRQNRDETQKLKRENDEERGEAVAKAGASGINISSFNDALLYNDLKTAKEVYDKEQQAKEQAYNLRRQAKNERRNRKSKAFSYSVGLLTDFGGFGS